MTNLLNRVLSSTLGCMISFVGFVAGTSGAVPASLTRQIGVLSVVKGTHTMVITFNQGYTALLAETCHVLQATYNATTGACEAKVIASAIDASGHTVTVGFFNAAGTAVDMAAGDVLRCAFFLKTTPGAA